MIPTCAVRRIFRWQEALPERAMRHVARVLWKEAKADIPTRQCHRSGIPMFCVMPAIVNTMTMISAMQRVSRLQERLPAVREKRNVPHLPAGAAHKRMSCRFMPRKGV